MSIEKHRVIAAFDRLLQAFGPQGWWPADTPFEAMVGAVLTQHTAWSNVEKALANLEVGGALSPEGLLALPEDVLADRIRPAGVFRVKAQRVRALVRFFVDRYGGDTARLQQPSMAVLRRELLAIKGVGPETADCILLYVAGKPSFVVDAYTRRIFSRLGLTSADIGYDALRQFFMDCVPEDVDVYQEYHALIVALGKAHCRPRPVCAGCPLLAMCAYGRVQ